MSWEHRITTTNDWEHRITASNIWWHVITEEPSGFSSAEYQVLYDAMTNKPSGTVATNQNAMIKTLVDGGVWSEVWDAFYMFSQEYNDDSEALINCITPGTNDATLVASPAFTSLEGFTGNASNASINTNFNPSTDGSKYTLNDNCFFIYIRDNQQEARWVCGVRDSSNITALLARHTTNRVYVQDCSPGNVYDTNTDSRGLFIVQRESSSTVQVYKNDTKILDKSLASAALVNNNVHVLSRTASAGNAADFTNHQVAFFGMGKALTAGQRTILLNAIETYMDSNSKGVIT